jgi:hypothetical protein
MVHSTTGAEAGGIKLRIQQMLNMEIKFLPHDFPGNKLPTAVGQRAKVKAFMGMRNLPVVVTAVLGGCVMAKIDA